MRRRRNQPWPRAIEMATVVSPTVPPDASLREAARLLERSGGDVLPVAEPTRSPRRILGALTRDTVERALRHGLGSRRVREFLQDPVPIVEAGAGPEEVAAALARCGAVIVKTASGKSRIERGIITAAGLVAHLGARTGREEIRLRDGMERAIPSAALTALRRVGRSAARRRERAWLVGGVVRDLLLGLEPRDLDVTVEGDACVVAGELAAELGGCSVVHGPFGTATVELSSGVRLDLATARAEFYPRPAALPEVVPAGIRRDLLRRDFTINALAVRLSPGRFGEVLDLFGGIADLEQRTIRVLHPLSFVEDPTRAFRAVRFATLLRFSMSPATARLARQAARERRPDLLSGTRLHREVRALFSSGRSASVVRLLASLELLGAIHPSLKTNRATSGRLRRADRIIAWYLRCCSDRPCRPWWVRLGVLAASLEPGKRRALARRLQPPRATRRFLDEAPEQARRIARSLSASKVSPWKIHSVCRDLPPETLLLAAALSPRREVGRGVRRFLTSLSRVRAELRGTDLLRAGVPPGPGIARGLEAALRARLEGRARTREEELGAALAALRRSPA